MLTFRTISLCSSSAEYRSLTLPLSYYYYLPFRAVETITTPTAAVPLNTSAAGSSQQPGISTPGPIDLIRDGAAVSECSHVPAWSFTEVRNRNRSLEILCSSSDQSRVPSLITNTSLNSQKSPGYSKWEWVTQSWTTSFKVLCFPI